MLKEIVIALKKSETWTGHKLQGRKSVHGMNVSVENRKGSVRRGVDKDGHEWSIKMNADYGRIRGTVGADGDLVDCYLGPNPESTRVFIINQNDPTTGKFDEQKVMLGFDSPEEAKALYLKQYDRPGFFGSMDETDIETFKAKAFADASKGKKLVVKAMQKMGAFLLTEKELREASKVEGSELAVGILVEMEHHEGRAEAEKIARDHLKENPDYYKKLIAAGLVDEPEAIREAKKMGLKKSDSEPPKPKKIVVKVVKNADGNGTHAQHYHVNAEEPAAAKKFKVIKQGPSEEEGAAFARAIDNLSEHQYGIDVVTPAPKKWAAVGADTNLPVRMLSSVLRKCIGERHELSKDQILAVQKAMFHPLVAFRSASKEGEDRIVLVTDVYDNENRPIVVTLWVNGDMYGRPANVITSIYGRNNFATHAEEMFRKGMVLWLDQKKIDGLSSVNRKRYPDASTIPSGCKYITPETLRNTPSEGNMKKAILVLPILEKARKSPRLIPVTKTVTRDGKTFPVTYWVLPSDAKAGKVQGGQGDLFDAPPPAAQLDLFDQTPGSEANSKPVIADAVVNQDSKPAAKPEEKKPESDKVYKDVGEKIGGARKDMWALIMEGKQALSSSDLEGMDDATAKTMVKKSLIVPADYIESLKDNGAQPGAAFMVSKLLAAVAPEPPMDTDGARRAYVTALERVIDGFRDVKTLDDFEASLKQLREEARGIMLTPEEMAARDKAKAEGEAYTKARRDAWYKIYDEESKKAPNSIYGANLARDRGSARLSKWEEENRSKFFSGLSIAKIEHAAMDRAREDPSSLMHLIGHLGKRLNDALTGRSNAFNENLGATSRTIKDWSWMEKKTGEKKERGTGRPKPVWERDTDENVERSGGADVKYTPNKLMEDFGFRGVEYGNWMDEQSSEHHTQMLGLSFNDLASILGIPVDQISFKKRLAIAFGARGKGKALAHYESDRKVINLTKYKGGGSLAHEWFHFLDNVARMAASGGEEKFSFMTDMEGELDSSLSRGKSRSRDYGTKQTAMDGVSPEVKAAWIGLTKAMHEGDYKAKKSDKGKNKYSRMGDVDRLISAGMSPQAVMDRISESNQNYLSYYGERKYETRLADYANYIHEKTDTQVSYGKGISNLLAASTELGDYWSRPIEMAARSFEAYVYDKMGEKKMRNTYLTKDRVSDSSCRAWAKVYDMPSAPYPMGDERKKINAAFDRLFEAIREDGTLKKAMEMDKGRLRKVRLWTIG